MHRIIGGIKVQDQLCGRGIKGSDEALHHGLMGGPGPRAVGGPVKTANGRGRGQPAIPPAGGLEGQIIAQGVMIVGIFIAERHGKHPLAQQRQQFMADFAGLSAIVQSSGQTREQPNPALRQIQQTDTAVRRDITATKISLNTPPPAGWKSNHRRGTIRHRRTSRNN
jgi:hypothetical protein